MNKNFLFYDVYERHKKIAKSIKKEESVLDVGGELNHLSQFIKSNKIVVANLNTGDVIINKNKLPFASNEFDYVCSIDVLEHIPKIKRGKFVKDLINIAKSKVILSFPIGTEKHIKYEKSQSSLLKEKGLSVSYLEEHVKYGLPKLDEIKDLVKGHKYDISFSGNIYFNSLLFNFFLFDPKLPFIRKLIYYSKLGTNFLTNPLLYFLLSNKKYSQNVNRAYLIIYK